MAREEEAARWLAKMRGPDAAAHRAAFAAWHADPANAAAFAKAEEDWKYSAALSPARIRARAATPRSVSRPTRWLTASFAVAALIGLAWAGMTVWIPQDRLVASSAPESSSVLADGSRVLLMDGARITADFDTAQRRVTLHGGRARFTVAKDSARPFTVIAGHSETRALGTIFEVDLRGGEPQVRLLEGRVTVRARGSAALELRPGESAAIARTGPRRLAATGTPTTASAASPAATSPPALRPAPVSATPADVEWIDADALPLGDIITRANAVNAVPIRLADAGLAARKVSGRFDLGDSAALARKLAAALGLDAEVRGDAIYLSRRKNPGG